jgi:hypothetical protein
MAAINFPDTPSVNDQYTEAGITWQYMGSGIWDLISTSLTGGVVDVGFGANFDGMGSVVLVNTRTYFRVPRAGTFLAWSIVAEGTSPTCTLDVWKIANGTALPTVSDTIMGTKPALSTGNAIRSTAMTGWTTTTFNTNDIFCINVDASVAATKISFLFEVAWS